MAFSLVAIPLPLHVHGEAASPNASEKVITQADPRVARLQSFLKRLRCPVAPMAEDFVRVADANQLDWRLLPSIAVIESGGGKAYKNNNIFGWNKGLQAFDSIRAGLEWVGYRLARSPLYRTRNSFEKLRIYNEDQEYADSVMAVMNRISSDVTIRTTSYENELGRTDVEEAGVIQF